MAIKLIIRARVEYVFWFIQNSMHGPEHRKIGIKRANQAIGMLNRVYNRFRFEQIIRLNLILLNRNSLIYIYVEKITKK
jgi:hypothetical protein